MENLSNQRFELELIKDESMLTLWQLSQKKLGNDMPDTEPLPHQVMELARDRIISLTPAGGDWFAASVSDIAAHHFDACPFRAVLICFLVSAKVGEVTA